MCGITGFVNLQNGFDRAEASQTLDRMCRVITHRGPDDQGVLVTDQVALGMRRLSIIDLAGGHQPIFNEDGTVAVIFNGEIYNYREIKRELEARGHRFRTNSDTETIVHAYEEYGFDCVDHFRGMFAFAIWDERARRLFIARDRVGKKPLYYTLTPQRSLIFGSELKALLEHPEVEREIDYAALDAYLTFGYVPDPLCIFRRVRKLPPGHRLIFANGEIKIEQYWDFDYCPIEGRSEEEWIEELRACLEDAVRVRLIADVPLGAFLSGGVDSSTVVGLMARAGVRPVKTFSIGFNEDSYNELKYARLAAKRFETDHHEFIVTPSICQIVDDLAWHFDEPFADSSAIPTYMVSKMARDYVTVVLSGDGGDELFAGYTRYAVDSRRAVFERLPRPLRRGVMQPVSRFLPHGFWGRNYLYNIALDSLDRYIDNVSVFTALAKEKLYSDDLKARLRQAGADATALFRERAAKMCADDSINRLLYLDSKTYLPGDILVKVDRMSMAVSLEARAPLLDHRLIELVGRIPPELKFKDGKLKYIFKRAVEGIVPPEILHRPKQGFGVPIDEWINAQLREQIRDTLMSSRARQRGYISLNYVQTLLEEHENGRRDHSTRLWTLFMLEKWARLFVDGEGDRARASFERFAPVASSG
ncbi:MAG: asparagine synthase (glutamine-hydrolyzing) [Pyrinomonas methylaliphatogenes]|nr:asparagine synthase (glutamine-hydrolyzing) [Pyrinomonas methylaliphatogenes]